MAIETHEYAERARESFNRRFWYQEGGHLYDVDRRGPSPLSALALAIEERDETSQRLAVELCIRTFEEYPRHRRAL